MTPSRAVSVIICTRNRSGPMRAVLACLQAQDYPADLVEIVVVDNNSTDDTADVVAQVAAAGGITVRYVHATTTRITDTRNQGAAAARYPYMAFIDDDCTMAADWLAQLMSGFDLDERVVAVGGLVVLHWEQPRPRWVGPGVARWLADTSYLGSRRRILEPDERVVEANTAFDRDAWRQAGGFLGMEQFGSRNMASGEVIHLLHQMRAQGGLVALVPAAVAHHHVYPPKRTRLLRRSYWQGVSDVMLAALLDRPSWVANLRRAAYESAALVALVLLAAKDTLLRDSAGAMFQFTRIARRVGVILTLLHFAGDWRGVANWEPAPAAGDDMLIIEEMTL